MKKMNKKLNEELVVRNKKENDNKEEKTMRKARKYVSLFVTVILAMAMLTACDGNSTPTPEPVVQTPEPTKAVEPTKAPTPTEVPEPTEAPTPTEEVEPDLIIDGFNVSESNRNGRDIGIAIRDDMHFDEEKLIACTDHATIVDILSDGKIYQMRKDVEYNYLYLYTPKAYNRVVVEGNGIDVSGDYSLEIREEGKETIEIPYVIINDSPGEAAWAEVWVYYGADNDMSSVKIIHVNIEE